MVHGKEIIFFYRGKGRVMYNTMHVKSTKRLPTHDVIYFIVQWYLRERHNLLKVPLGHPAETAPVAERIAASSELPSEPQPTINYILGGPTDD